MKLLNQTYPEYGGLILRLSLGVMWLAHAGLKLFVFTIPGLSAWLPTVGFPSFLAIPLVSAEIIGGTMILLGIYSRYVSIALLPILLGALFIHSGNGWVFTAQGGGWEYPLFLITASISHILIGDQMFALRKSAQKN